MEGDSHTSAEKTKKNQEKTKDISNRYTLWEIKNEVEGKNKRKHGAGDKGCGPEKQALLTKRLHDKVYNVTVLWYNKHVAWRACK